MAARNPGDAARVIWPRRCIDERIAGARGEDEDEDEGAHHGLVQM
jgi:hypothetical protein